MVVTALALLAGYGIAVQTGRVPPTDGFQVRDKNRIRCETYLLDPRVRPDVVLVGSSLTANLPIQDVSPRIFNLGLAGDSLWTGLEIIRGRPDFRPRVIVIEGSDLLLREGDRAFLDSLLSPGPRWARQHLKMLRTEYQPAGVFLKTIGRWQKRRRATSSPPPPPEPTTLAAGANPPEVLPITQRLIAEARETGQNGLSPAEQTQLRAACARLRPMMEQFQADGTQCLLQHVPGDATLADTPRNQQLAALLEGEFPATKYVWVPPSTGFQGRTWDAVHLTEGDAAAYARYLCLQLEPRLLSPHVRSANQP